MNQDSYKKQRHDVVRERQNKKELEVFVGGLDRYTNEVDLRDVFSQVGDTLFVGNIARHGQKIWYVACSVSFIFIWILYSYGNRFCKEIPFGCC